MRSYELMYILDPSLDEDASGALLGRIGELMSKEGVEVEKTEPWGKRRLAYAVKGHWEGTYVLSYLKAEPTAVSEIERRLRVTDGVLRFLTVRIDETNAKLERQRAHKAEGRVARKKRKGAATAAAATPAPAAATPAPAAATPAAAAAPPAPTAETTPPPAETAVSPAPTEAAAAAEPEAAPAKAADAEKES